MDVASKLWIEPLTTYLIHSLVVLSFENLKSPKKNIKSSKTTRLFFFCHAQFPGAGRRPSPASSDATVGRAGEEASQRTEEVAGKHMAIWGVLKRGGQIMQHEIISKKLMVLGCLGVPSF